MAAAATRATWSSTRSPRSAATACRPRSPLLFVAAPFAGMLAFHNAASRYLFVLGRDRVLPGELGRAAPEHRSPYRGQPGRHAAAPALIVVIAIVFQLDPYVVLAQGAVGLATLGIVALQAMAAVAIVVFFRRRGQGRYWKTLILPGIGALGLLAAPCSSCSASTTLRRHHDRRSSTALPWLLVAVMVAGVVTGLVIRAAPARPVRPAGREPAAPAGARRCAGRQRWTRRYCLIGAGPAGLAMAPAAGRGGRAVRLVRGGTTTSAASGTSTARAARCTRPASPPRRAYTSGFPDFPMPADYPDYPTWWQVRDYLRATPRPTACTTGSPSTPAVTWVKPEGVGWSVTLTTGEFRYYSGVIAAPGTAWHPVASRPGPGPGALPRPDLALGPVHAARPNWPAGGCWSSGPATPAPTSPATRPAAAEAAFLSVRRGQRFLPRHVGGVPTDAVLAGVLDPPDRMALPPDAAELVAAAVGDVTPLGLPQPDPQLLAGPPDHEQRPAGRSSAQGWIGGPAGDRRDPAGRASASSTAPRSRST